MASKVIPADEEKLDDVPRRGGGDEVDHGEGVAQRDNRDGVDIERVPGGDDEEVNPANPVTGDYEGSEPAEG